MRARHRTEDDRRPTHDAVSQVRADDLRPLREAARRGRGGRRCDSGNVHARSSPPTQSTRFERSARVDLSHRHELLPQRDPQPQAAARTVCRCARGRDREPRRDPRDPRSRRAHRAAQPREAARDRVAVLRRRPRSGRGRARARQLAAHRRQPARGVRDQRAQVRGAERGMSEHGSALLFDRIALGQPATDHIREHLDSCAACRTRQAEAAALHGEFTRRLLPRGLPARRWQRRWLFALPALAAAAIVVLVLMRNHDAPGDELGIKGDAAWQAVAKHGERTVQGRDGPTLAPRDQIRFVVVPNGARYVMIASIDGAGTASIYVPYYGAASERIDGAIVELPGSIVLDVTPGPERLYALFSAEPLAADAVKAKLRELTGAAAIRKGGKLDIAARAQLSLVFEKAAP